MKNIFVKLLIVAVAGVLVYYTFFYAKADNIQPLTESWEKVVPYQEVPEGLNSLSSKECGACHQNHYEEWKYSTHSHAWTDPQFQAELKKESSPFMCINCHIPLQNQQEFIVEGLIDGDIYRPVFTENPHFDRELQQEGINCASCHVRDNAIVGPTGTDKAPHKTIKDPDFLSESLCISCHNAVAEISPTLACSFETGDEWEEGPYAKDKNCISCHMEEVQREIVPGFGERKSHYHYFAGSGIPKFDSLETKVMSGLGIYPSALEETYSKGDSIRFNLRIKNEFAGHSVPTGDPERFYLISFVLRNELDSIIQSSEGRIGEHWEWYPIVKKIADNNLLPNEERFFNFSYFANKKGSYKLTAQVSKHRLDKASAEYNKLTKHYPLSIPVFDEEYFFKVK
jgi:nitrate/TMAO reductase-like tetraheme cytochrome c subunit